MCFIKFRIRDIRIEHTGDPMPPSAVYNSILIVALAVYFAVSKLIFDKVYNTSDLIIDELFHIPQGISYCNGNFSYWDDKITTLPGLYLVSATIGSYFQCNIYNLRFVNLIASCINLILLSSMMNFVYGHSNNGQLKIVMQALNLAILPPLYFFSHVYYTDTISLLFLLLFSRLCIVNKSKWLIFIVGISSVIMRQTNVVWVAMVFGHKVLDIMIKSSRVYGNRYLSKTHLSKRSIIANEIDSSKLRRYYGIVDLVIALRYHLSTLFKNFFSSVIKSEWYVLTQQAAILFSFVAFLYFNGSIVVGDKQAHTVTVNFPQLLYFLLFYGVFGLPYVLGKFNSTIKLMFNNKLNVLIFGIIFGFIVHFNTVIHPYLLADNRHYTFYIWNRWFGKYDFAIYATIPIYLFLLFSLYDNLRGQNCISFLLPYLISLVLALSLQRLVEIRYFLVPFIILRLRFVRPSFVIVMMEFIWYLMINAVTLHLFFTKQIIWKDFSEVQRIMW